ncbi:hypothetical protein F5144DRAFT_180490 [Chaetomium tenue]|uniref:Uncharacterized protein n=1 Tax=Chaetomium tenue TaxID=1854479 RepID=A0ACB7PB91_9PEZI|nr:hypothetical protein F5144DRAFT_180490 [Chaetomium globosum]
MDPLLDNGGPEPVSNTPQSVLRTAQLLYPVILLLTFIISAGVHTVVTSKTEEQLAAPTVRGPGGKPLPITKKKREEEVLETNDDARGSGGFAWCAFLYLTGALVMSFVANGAAIAAHAMSSGNSSKHAALTNVWWCGDERIVYVVGSAFLYLYVLITLLEWRQSPIVVHFIVWTLGLVGEVVILVASILALAGSGYLGYLSAGLDSSPGPWDTIDLGIAGFRLCLLVALVSLYVAVTKRRLEERRLHDEEAQGSDTDEVSPLLNGNGDYHGHANGHATRRTHYGSTIGNTRRNSDNPTDQGCQQQDQGAAFYRPDKLPHKSWFEYCRGYSVFFPYLWPSRSARLKIVVVLCFILVILQRVVNILVPAQLGIVTDTFEKNVDKVWIELGLLILYKLLQGPSGLLGSVRSILWVPVSQHTYRALTTAAFEHVHSLSLDFHLGKRTGEVLSALNKGASINQFLEQVTFQVVPMLVDLLVAIIYFYIRFGSLYALFVSIITFYYLYLTIRMAATRSDQRRDMVNADREEEAVKNDSIMSYETVKYFNAERREFDRYGDAVKKFQEAEAQVTYGINHMNMCQSVVFMCGLLVALLTCGYQVSRGDRTVGDFVLLVTYLNQLQGPLNFFGTFYRTVQSAMISGERLLELFKIQPTVVDKPNVEPLRECTGHIKWNGVGFSYDKRRTALQDLSFECKPGTTTAFVGESGGGKSTVFRLMFRYYNCREGSIEIDGHDVKDVSIDSVRRFIGVVPQDTILFNETLMYNLKYANPNATDEDVFDACRAAAIHDRIMSFPDGYLTKVGERGLRLSGGEKQRVAIARTILKNPKIIMLDEATSALDGETEQKIQSKLISGKFGQDRTLLIIAHRLSTITHADQIIVLHAGTVAERGTHQELLALNGRYSAMWEKHCRAEKAAEHARDATRKAKKLLSQANIGDDGYNSMLSSTILPTAPHSPAATAADAHETASISSRMSSTSSSGSDGTLQDDGSDGNEGHSGKPDDGPRPLLYSFPSESSAGRSTDASRSP